MPVPRRLRSALVAALATLLLSACGASTLPDGAGTPPLAAPAEAVDVVAPVVAGSGTVDVGGRPVSVQVPPGYDAAHPAPLLVLLHGYGSGPDLVDTQLGLRAAAAARGALYAVPEGTQGPDGRRFWNATDACCGRDRAGIDDSAYLALVVRTLAATYAVDTERVAVVGYSNGGFMAYRMACDHADLVTVVVSLAGAMPADDDACDPARPVRVVEAHGTDDRVIAIDGGRRDGHPYPSAARSAAAWARTDGCDDEPSARPALLDLWSTVPGPETTVLRWTGCAGSSGVELWSIAGAGHQARPTQGFADAVLDAVTEGG